MRPPSAVSTPVTLNVPPIVVPEVLLPIVVAPVPALLVFIFTNWVNTTAFLCPMNKFPAAFVPPPIFISETLVRVPVPM